MPRVSVGVPTFNGAAYLQECLECLANQTFTDLEVIVVDNASTDGTASIAEAFCARDPRFRYHRNPATIPATENFRRAFDLSTAPYFMWRADDDLSALDFVEQLAGALDIDAKAGLAVGAVKTTFPDGTDQLRPLPVRDDAATLLAECHPAWIYGLWRKGPATDDLFKAQSAYPYLWASDHIAMLPVIVRAEVALCPHATFHQRIVRVPTYGLRPSEMLKARKAYAAIAMTLVNGLVTKRDMEAHIERRVARLFKTYKRIAEAKIRGVLGLRQRH